MRLVPSRDRTPRRRRLAAISRSLAVAGGFSALLVGLAAPSQGTTAAPTTIDAPSRQTLERYLRDTYRSLDAMTVPATGLPADNIEGDLDVATRSAYTSPTNIGGWLWSTVVARDAGIVTDDEAYDLMSRTITTLATMDRHDQSGMYYNWYDPATGDRVDTWPDNGDPVHHFLSSVDNGWLAAALRVVAEAEPRLADEAKALYDSMDFGVFYNPEGRADKGVGLIRGGFWDEEPPGCSVTDNYLGTGADVYYTCHHYDTTVSETRIALYLGIANGQIPAKAYYGTHRTFPSDCDWSWPEQRPSGVERTYLGVPVYEGAYPYRGMAIVPGWGGSMFEALMPDLFVPEAQWGPTSWGVNHPLVVRAHKEHGLDEAGYGYWGFSPASNPNGGYAEYGVDVLGMRSDGYLSDGTTDVDLGYHGCRDATNATPTFGDGVVTPHASFLGLAYDIPGVLANLEGIENDLDAYGPGGFYDSVATRSGKIAERYLSLDQAMIVGAIGNLLDEDTLKDYFVDDALEDRLRPLMAAEVFGAHAEAIVPTLTQPADGTALAASPTTLGGTGEPGATVTVSTGGGALCAAKVDADGAWTCTLETPLAVGDHALTLSQINDSGITVTGEATLTIEATSPTAEPTASPTTEPSGEPSPSDTATTGPASASPTTVATTGASESAQAKRGGALARTGSDLVPLGLAAGLALCAGISLVVVRRVRRRS